MKIKPIRAVMALAVLLLGVSGVDAQEHRITARELVAEIQKQVGVEWKKDTVDTFKAGNPDTPVTGIAVTMMATMDVLQRASAKGFNFRDHPRAYLLRASGHARGNSGERFGVGGEADAYGEAQLDDCNIPRGRVTQTRHAAPDSQLPNFSILTIRISARPSDPPS